MFVSQDSQDIIYLVHDSWGSMSSKICLGVTASSVVLVLSSIRYLVRSLRPFSVFYEKTKKPIINTCNSVFFYYGGEKKTPVVALGGDLSLTAVGWILGLC